MTKKNFRLPEQYPSQRRLSVSAEVVAEIATLYEAGRYLDAYAVSQKVGPLQAWSGADALVMASRLANNINAARLGDLLISRAWRAAPNHAEVRLHFAYRSMERYGLMHAWKLLDDLECLDGRTPLLHADLLALKAEIASIYRDFSLAWQLWEEADRTFENSPWLHVTRSRMLQNQENYDQALDAVDLALDLRPWYRPAVQQKARFLHMQNRRDEAIALLTAALENIQSAPIAAQLMSLKREADDDEGMLELLHRFEQWSPLLLASDREWLAARRADAYYLRGDLLRAAEEAERCGGEYYEPFAQRLRAASSPGRRVRLPVDFVLQGHRTCGPATLAALAHFWKHPATQEQIIESIWYDGTYDYSERRWAEHNGFAVREFSVTPAVTRRLIDAGIPFALTTVDLGSAHLQAVIGYDELRETIFIQDPSEPHFRELECAQFFKEYSLTGPRGMAMVPQAQAALLDAVDLGDAARWDDHFAFHAALGAYRREEALAALERLRQAGPEAPLTLLAELALANFDGHSTDRMALLEKLLGLFPDDRRLLYWKLNALREMGRREERLALLRHAIRLEDAHPIFLKELAVETLADMRGRAEAKRLLWLAHSRLPLDASVLTALGDLAWRGERSVAVLDYYRFAAALVDKREDFAETWFNACLVFNRANEALAWQRQRFEAFGAKSSGPALTLAACLDRIAQTQESFGVLDQAVALRPDDGELLLAAARYAIRYGYVEKAQELIQQAHGKCPEGQWKRALAALHRRQGNTAAALELWREILKTEPLSMEAHHHLARSLTELEGTPAALAHLEKMCAQFPHHFALHQLWLNYVRDGDASKAVPVVKKLLEINPADAWAQRELAFILCDNGRHAEALEAAQHALALAPDSPAGHMAAALAFRGLKRTAEAADACREAIRKNVNYGDSFACLLESLEDSAARLKELDFIRSEMIRQVLDGNGLHAYRSVAYPLVEPKDLLRQMREIWLVRPDLWEAWSVYGNQAMDSGDASLAENLAQEAADRFPLLPGAWRDLATAKRLLGKSEEAISAARQAVALNPDWAAGWETLADLLEDNGQMEEALGTLRLAARRLPLEGNLKVRFAGMLWRGNHRDEAWQLASDLVLQDPGQSTAWSFLAQWAPHLRKEPELLALARRITETRPGEARSWLILDECLPSHAIDEKLAALRRAVELNPHLPEAYDLQAEYLGGLGRTDEATAVIHSGPWQGQLPFNLRGRLAWLAAVGGQVPKAMALMREVLQDHRDYFWGWERMADWASETKQAQEYREAVRELMRLSPRNPVPCCYAADFEAEMGSRTEAESLYRKALLLDPSHPYAARRLADSLYVSGDLSGLEQALHTMLPQGSTGWIRKTYQVLLAWGRHQDAGAAMLLDELITAPDPIAPLHLVIDQATAKDPQRRAIVAEKLERFTATDQIGPTFAVLWVRIQCEQQRYDVWQNFERWLARMGERAHSAIDQFITLSGDNRSAAKGVQPMLNSLGPILAQDTTLWGRIGYALCNSNLHSATVAWLLGGESRPDAQGWMLSNLITSLRRTGKMLAAGKVALAVVERGLRDATWDTSASQAAYYLASQGEMDRVPALLATLGNELDETSRCNAALAHALWAVLTQQGDASKTAFRGQLKSLRQMAKQMQRQDEITIKQYEDTVRRMKEHCRAIVWPSQLKFPRTD